MQVQTTKVNEVSVMAATLGFKLVPMFEIKNEARVRKLCGWIQKALNGDCVVPPNLLGFRFRYKDAKEVSCNFLLHACLLEAAAEHSSEDLGSFYVWELREAFKRMRIEHSSLSYNLWFGNKRETLVTDDDGDRWVVIHKNSLLSLLRICQTEAANHGGKKTEQGKKYIQYVGQLTKMLKHDWSN